MNTNEYLPQANQEPVLHIMDIFNAALSAQNIDEFGRCVVPGLAATLPSSAALLFISDPRLSGPYFTSSGSYPIPRSELEDLCAERMRRLSRTPGSDQLLQDIPSDGLQSAQLALYPLRINQKAIGLLGMSGEYCADQAWSAILERLAALLSHAVDALITKIDNLRQISHLNTYLTVSSMLSQSLDLHELLEATLYCCMEVVSAETASILLLDDEKKNFNFYQIEGPAKPVLLAASFPASQGLAGAVLQSQESEVVNDVQGDHRFYKKVDSESGFITRNMIAVPLTAGEEKVGVLEVINKIDSSDFSDFERLMLVSIAEEIAFAIRNARMFEYVVNTYCKQRQGLMSCRGCNRPLGSWTPCVKYRAAGI